MNRIIWLTGPSGAGKTTLARKLQEHWPCIILDGDAMRRTISETADFSPLKRAEHNYRVARLALELAQQVNIVVSVIAPIRKVREMIQATMPVEWIYVKRSLPERPGHFYEESDDYPTLDQDKFSIEENTARLLGILKLPPKVKSEGDYVI